MTRAQPTRLFQLPLTESDVARFKNPDTQPKEGATNCAAVSAQLIGLITPGISSTVTEEKRGTWIMEWVGSMNQAAGFDAYSVMRSDIRTLFDSLFAGHATMVLAASSITELGHYFVIARDNDGIPYILDPQAARDKGDAKSVFEGDEKIQAYMESGGFTLGVMAFKTKKPMSVSEHMSLYATSALLALFVQSCSV